MAFSNFSIFFLLCGTLAANVYGEDTHRRTKRATCETEYSAISPQHSMCLTDKGTEVALSEAEKQAIVDQHNQLRAVQGQGQPQATNMQKIIWDDEIAKVASKWVRQCGSGVTAHESDAKLRSVKTLPGVPIGQNAANGFATFQDAVQAWYDEVSDFQYGVGATKSDAVVGHYTQVVNANVARIGCGKAMCNSKPYYVCDYAKAQMINDMKTPYETGNGDQCSNHRDATRTLCDCNGLICLNGGTIDLQTCTCSCTGLYKGTACDQHRCAEQQLPFCQYLQVLPSQCNDALKSICPKKCGLCSGPACNGKICPSGEYLNRDSCGCVALNVDCNVIDNQVCGLYFASGYPNEFCFSDVGAGVCPNSCGHCAAPVCSKVCKNGGILLMSDCSCNCPLPFYGPECELNRCITSDEPFCPYQTFTSTTCPDPVKTLCPDFCGLCPEQCPNTVCNPGELLMEIDCSCKIMGDCNQVDDPLCDLFINGGDLTEKCEQLTSSVKCPHKCGTC